MNMFISFQYNIDWSDEYENTYYDQRHCACAYVWDCL